jgi:outer membrane receptor protein involved in Fe transport
MKATVGAAVSAVLGIAGTSLSQVSTAQVAPQPAGTDVVGLETVIVTAQKREESIADVPMSLSALGGARLDDLQARDFSDYAPLVPGLSLASVQSGQTRLTLRGQNAGGIGSTVSVYVDESPFGSSTALVNGSVNTGDFDTWDMQRIEVLRGPQGTLYGANSEGGLLKFVTNAPELGKFSLAGEASGESVDHGGNGWDARALVNLPLGDKTALRVSGFYDEVPGYIDDPASGRHDLNDGRKYGGRASLLVAATEDLSIRLTAISQTSNYNGVNTVDVDPVTLKPLYGDLTQERVVPEPSHFRYDNYNASINWNLGAFSLLSTTSYGILDADNVTDGTPIYGGLAGGLFGGTGAPLVGDTELKKFTQEIRLTSGAKERLEWQVGGYFTHESASVDQNLNAVTASTGQFLGLLLQPVIDSTYKEGAGFLDLTYHFNSQFDLQAGGRWSSNSQDATQTTLYDPTLASILGVVPNPQVVNGSSSEHVWTYSLAPSWHFDKNGLVYARLASGYRPGGPNVLPPNAPPDVQRQYGSDKTTNVELGVRSTLLDGRFSLDLAAFHVDWKNIQLLEVVGGFGINANGGTARSQGVEWTFGYVPVEGLTLQWTGAYTDAYLTSDAPAINAVSGDRLPYAPKWGTSLDAEYKRTAFGDFSGFIGATYSYVGDRSSDFATSSATPPGQVVLPSYNTYGARLGLENGRYRLTLYAKNLSDSRGFTNYTNSGSPYSTVTVTDPRTIGLTVSAKF